MPALCSVYLTTYTPHPGDDPQRPQQSPKVKFAFGKILRRRLRSYRLQNWLRCQSFKNWRTRLFRRPRRTLTKKLKLQRPWADFFIFGLKKPRNYFDLLEHSHVWYFLISFHDCVRFPLPFKVALKQKNSALTKFKTAVSPGRFCKYFFSFRSCYYTHLAMTFTKHPSCPKEDRERSRWRTKTIILIVLTTLTKIIGCMIYFFLLRREPWNLQCIHIPSILRLLMDLDQCFLTGGPPTFSHFVLNCIS